MPGLLGALNQSMNQNVPALGQSGPTSPNFDPSLQVAPPSPMPQGSPMSAVHRAFQRRGMPVPPQIQSTSNPMVNTPPSQIGLTNPTQPEVTLPVQDQNPQQPGVQVPMSEAQLILKALSSRLGTLGKHEEAIRDHLFPKVQAA